MPVVVTGDLVLTRNPRPLTCLAEVEGSLTIGVAPGVGIERLDSVFTAPGLRTRWIWTTGRLADAVVSEGRILGLTAVRRVVLRSDEPVTVVIPGERRHDAPAELLEVWVDLEVGSGGLFYVMPAYENRPTTYEIDGKVLSAYAAGAITGSSSTGGGSSTTVDPVAWEREQASLEIRLAAIDRQLVFAREGSERQVQCLGDRR